MNRLNLLNYFSLLTCLALTSPLASAHSKEHPIEPDHEVAKALVASGTIRSLDQTLADLLRYCDAELLDAHLYQSEQQWRYDLYVRFRQGVVQSLIISAADGVLISPEKLPGDCLPNEAAAR